MLRSFCDLHKHGTLNSNKIYHQVSTFYVSRSFIITDVLTLNPTRDFSFLDYLLGKGGVQNGGSPWIRTGGLSGVAAWAAISCPHDTCYYDVMGLSVFSSLPLVGFCWTEEG